MTRTQEMASGRSHRGWRSRPQAGWPKRGLAPKARVSRLRSGPSFSFCISAASISRASRRRSGRRGRRRIARRELLALPAALALLVPAAPAFAQTSSTGTSGYGQVAPPPKTTPEAKKETAPSKEATTPTTSTSPTTTTPTTTVAPTTTTTPTTTPKASTLPFTGLNLTWVLGAGVLLLAAGLSIRLAQRTRAGR